MSVLSIRMPIRKRSGNLSYAPRIYIYIYVCVCVCVCACVCVRVFIRYIIVYFFLIYADFK